MNQQRPKSNLAQIVLAVCAFITVFISIGTCSSEIKNEPKINLPEKTVKKIEDTALNIKDETFNEVECLEKILEKEYNIFPYCYSKLIIDKDIDRARSLLKMAKKSTIKKQKIDLFNSELNDLDLIEKLNLDNAYGEYSEYTSLIVRNEKYGVSTKEGKILFECIFNDADPQVFYPLIMVEENGKQGFVNQVGKIIHTPKFTSTDPQLAYPLIAFQLDSLWGIMDTLGNILQEPQFEPLMYVTESRIGVEKNGKFGFINNENGNVEVEIKYSEIEPFDRGKAKVRLFNKEFWIGLNGKKMK